MKIGVNWKGKRRSSSLVSNYNTNDYNDINNNRKNQILTKTSPNFHSHNTNNPNNNAKYNEYYSNNNN
jgi:hypothetical protein